jgi:hypothetical protein
LARMPCKIEEERVIRDRKAFLFIQSVCGYSNF